MVKAGGDAALTGELQKQKTELIARFINCAAYLFRLFRAYVIFLMIVGEVGLLRLASTSDGIWTCAYCSRFWTCVINCCIFFSCLVVRRLYC